MTTNIIAIDESELKCPECGNSDPRKFSVITTPFTHEGQVHGCTLSGVVCRVCQTSVGFDHVANSSWR
jgi:hypothetical protein